MSMTFLANFNELLWCMICLIF